MSIALAAIVASITGVVLRNLIGYLQESSFDTKKSVASAIVAFLIGLPVVITAFTAGFEGVETIPETAQLTLFAVQITAIAGFDALAKSGLKARSKSE